MRKLILLAGILPVIFFAWMGCEEEVPDNGYKPFINMPFISEGFEMHFDYRYVEDNGDSINKEDYYVIRIGPKVMDGQYKVYHTFKHATGDYVDTTYWILTTESWFESRVINDTSVAFRYYFTGRDQQSKVNGDSTLTEIRTIPFKMNTAVGEYFVHQGIRYPKRNFNSFEAYYIDQYRQVGILKIRQQQNDGRYSEYVIRKTL